MRAAEVLALTKTSPGVVNIHSSLSYRVLLNRLESRGSRPDPLGRDPWRVLYGQFVLGSSTWPQWEKKEQHLSQDLHLLQETVYRSPGAVLNPILSTIETGGALINYFVREQSFEYSAGVWLRPEDSENPFPWGCLSFHAAGEHIRRADFDDEIRRENVYEGFHDAMQQVLGKGAFDRCHLEVVIPRLISVNIDGKQRRIEVRSHRHERLSGSRLNLRFHDGQGNVLSKPVHQFGESDDAVGDNVEEFGTLQIALENPGDAARLDYEFYVPQVSKPILTGSTPLVAQDYVGDAPMWQVLSTLLDNPDWTLFRRNARGNQQITHQELVVGGLLGSAGLTAVHAPGPRQTQGVDIVALAEDQKRCYLISCHEGSDWRKKLRTLLPQTEKVSQLDCLRGWTIQAAVLSDSSDGLLPSDRDDAADKNVALITDVEALKKAARSGGLDERRTGVFTLIEGAVPKGDSPPMY